MDDMTTTTTGISRRAAVTRLAVGAGAVWAAPAVTGLGRALAATGSPAPARPTTLDLTYVYQGTPYQHTYVITTASDGSFTGTGSVSDGHKESITGSFTGSSLSLVSVYDNKLVYRVQGAVVLPDGTFTGTGNIDGQNDNSPVNGHIG